MIVLAEPAPEDMVRAVTKAIDMLPGINPQVMHLQVKFNSQISTHCINSSLYHVTCEHFTGAFKIRDQFASFLIFIQLSLMWIR
jgi:hypothetical protein